MSGYIDPDKERFQLFKDLPRDGEIHMLNLVRFNEIATYPDGTTTTGAQAYATYGKESGPIFKSLGGEIVWSGDFRLMLIGPQDERWDACFIARYPNAEAFISMIRNADYQKAVRHRQAAVSDSRLIRLDPKKTGAVFA